MEVTAGASDGPAPGDRLVEVAGGWAGDLAHHAGSLWVAWAECDDPEPQLFGAPQWDWPARRAGELPPGLTLEAWRQGLEGARFAVRFGRLAAGEPEDVREAGAGLHEPGRLELQDVMEVGAGRHAVEGPTLAPLPGAAAPAVMWGEREPGRSALRAAVGGVVETVTAGAGAVLGPRAATDGRGRLWVCWQQWPGPQHTSETLASESGGGKPWVCVSWRDPVAPPGSASAWSPPRTLSAPDHSGWAPSLAAGPDGALWCAWDAWDGAGYAISLRRHTDASGWSAPVRVSPPDRSGFHFAPDVAAGSGRAWVVWNRSQRWGELNHRFNHIRTLHAAVVTAADDPSGETLTVTPAPGTPPLGGEAGQLPVPSLPFMHMEEEEFITPLAPKIRLATAPASPSPSPSTATVVAGTPGTPGTGADGTGADTGVVVLFRRFRSGAFKDFGWTLWALRNDGAGWSEAHQVSTHSGFPDTPYGVAPEDGSWLLAYHAGEYVRAPDRHPSQPVGPHRLVVERVALPPAGPLSSQGATTTAAPVAATTAATSPGRAGRDDRPAPRAVTSSGKTYVALYGDLHRHSSYSKCMSANDGDPLDHWRWAQDVAALDFYALTEHLEYMSFLEWRRIEDLAEGLAAGGRVLALCGFELAIPPGHTNFFYADQAVGHDLRVACLRASDLQAVWPILDATIPPEKIVAIRHHQGHRRDDVGASYSPRWEPVAEIVQTRGEYPAWVQHLWRQGFKVGVVGASDHSRGAPFVQALTGLWIDPGARSREGVLAGLRARRTFATNGPRMSVFLSVTGAADDPRTSPSSSTSPSAPVNDAGDGEALAMGESGAVDGAPRLRVVAGGTCPLETIELYRGSDLLHVQSLQSLQTTEHTLTWTDHAPPPGEHPYWVRVTQGQERNGRRPHRGVAYSSPVFVQR